MLFKHSLQGSIFRGSLSGSQLSDLLRGRALPLMPADQVHLSNYCPFIFRNAPVRQSRQQVLKFPGPTGLLSDEGSPLFESVGGPNPVRSPSWRSHILCSWVPDEDAAPPHSWFRQANPGTLSPADTQLPFPKRSDRSKPLKPLSGDVS